MGKEVKRFLLTVRNSFTGYKTAMKIYQHLMIEKIKAYDEKSDMAKVTGIDDGNEQTVLDFWCKERSRNFVNADVSAGTK